MSGVVSTLSDTGLEVLDLHTDPSFAERHLHVRDGAMHMEGMHRLARAFVESPDTILQELVNAAVDLCGADSAGISIQKKNETGETFYHWIATAGQYARFMDSKLPPFPSACGICIERGRSQLFRVSPLFFDLMGIEAEIVSDGILIPWHVEEVHGTLWIMAHERTEAFDDGDHRLMQALANFAAMGVRQQRQQSMLMYQAKAAAAAAVANDLAHKINNPLQSVTNILYLASKSGGGAEALADELAEHILRLSLLVGKLLALPSGVDSKK
jgi:signal transduction histidine kinase